MLTDVLLSLSWSWDDWGWVPPEPCKSQEDEPKIVGESGWAGTRGLERTPGSSVLLLVRAQRPCRRQQRKLLACWDFSPKLLELARASPKARAVSRCLLEICSHETLLPRASGESAKEQISLSPHSLSHWLWQLTSPSETSNPVPSSTPSPIN